MKAGQVKAAGNQHTRTSYHGEGVTCVNMA